MSSWIERTGMICDFLSFWLVAPEILGEERLRRAETFITKVFAWLLPRLQEGYKRSVGRDLPLTLDGFLEQEQFVIRYVLATGMVLLLAIVFNLVYLPREGDLAILVALINLVMGLVVSCILIALLAILVSRVLRYLYQGEQLRYLLIFLGALVYLMGFILQFTATFR